jgi:spermidine synthase
MRSVCYGVFFASGFAALLYQVIWQRILAIFSGADVYSATIIVAAFMAGLGIGSLTGGHIADRVSRRTNLMLFGAAELGIAVFGFVSARLYYDLLYVRLGPIDIPPAPLAAILFVSLLWPTFLMGASLPLLARALTRHIDAAATTIGTLYGVNTLGAATGAMFATWWLLPRIGLEGSLGVGATMNAVCALAILPFAFLTVAAAPAASLSGSMPAATETLPATQGELTFRTWVWIYAFSGFLALSLEIVWFRTLGVMMKSTAFTFGTLLAIYLAGLGSGSIAGGRLARRIRRHAAVFLALQAAAGLSAIGLLAIVVSLVDQTRALLGYFGSYEPISIPESVTNLRAAVANVLGSGPPAQVPANFIRFYIGLPIVLVLPPTFLMGCSFPVLQRVVQSDLELIGRRVGLLLVANIAGSVAGTMLTGWVLLNVLGTPATFKLLASLSTLFAVLAVALLARSGQLTFFGRRWAAIVAIVLAVAVAVPVLALMPGGGAFWARLHGTTLHRILYGEDGSGLAVIKMYAPELGGKHVVFVNGLGQSTLPYGDIHTALGVVPAFLHPNPRSAAVIGLGSGDTVHAVAGRPDIERITSIEIVRPQLDALEQLRQRWRYDGLDQLLSSTRIEQIFGDGRIHLMRGGRTYDLIEADALRPGSAYSGNLYSEEYFKLVAARLTPNGLAATWAPTARVENSFIRAFPYVIALPGMMVGSNEPIEIDPAAIASRAADPRVRRYYQAAGIDIERLLNEYLAAPKMYTPAFDRASLTDYNTDLFPRDEYDLTFSRR